MDLFDGTGDFLHCEPLADPILTDGAAGTPGKIIRITGESRNVTFARLAGGGFRIEGALGLGAGETILLLLLGEPVIELSVRWVAGDQAGAVVGR